LKGLTNRLQLSRERGEMRRIEREFAFRVVRVEIADDPNLAGGRRQNIGKPTSLEELILAGVCQRWVAAADPITTAERQEDSGDNE
jgi:hypothetical protein